MNTTTLCLAHTALLLPASPCFAEEVLETWTSDEDATRVKFDQCGDALCGNVVKPGSDVKDKVGRRLFYDMRRDGTRSRSGKAGQPRERLMPARSISCRATWRSQPGASSPHERRTTPGCRCAHPGYACCG